MAFGKKIELLVGKKNNENLKISSLKIEFQVTKTSSTGDKTNNAVIKVYNVSKDTETRLCTAGNHVILKAGYSDELVSTILLGDIVKSEKKRTNTGNVIEIKVSDGREQIMKGNVSVSYAKDTNVSTVVQSFTDVLGFPVKGTENISASEKFIHGFSYIGMASEGLNQVLNRIGLTFVIQNEMLYIKKPEQSVQNLGLKLTKDTGLLTIPQIISDKTNSSKIEQKNVNMWQFKTLLFPQLVPNAVCQIQSSTLNGQIIIEKAIFKGNNFDGDFIVEIEGREQ